MFDLSFGELAMIAVVALLVLGPERLPGAARTAGALLRRLRNSWQGVRSEIERELAAEDIKRSIRDTTRGVDLREEIRSTAEQVRSAASGEPGKAPSDEHH
ncbi:MAG: Sec-independent protein translocase protein TatB [Dokdonella sp.]|uniref:Sec-independent protein translocase protein TatB n=1 Tax=Dokdonella sp. TaxID=2291710 RepID=UPI002C27F831|nr:Sec-independent protein translocase protein TatB [Dokdonella sp.]HOX71519.1 Sec-independent protein translocase protein TatB [Dokdonella sp.]